MSVVVTEFALSTNRATGRTWEYVSGTFEDGARSALYYARLRDGRAEMGTTGRIIYPHGHNGDLAWVVTRGES